MSRKLSDVQQMFLRIIRDSDRDITANEIFMSAGLAGRIRDKRRGLLRRLQNAIEAHNTGEADNSPIDRGAKIVCTQGRFSVCSDPLVLAALTRIQE